MTRHHDQLALEYEGLPDDCSLAGQLCPACKGGDSSERSLSVSRVGGAILYQCHRASCGFKGRIITGRPANVSTIGPDVRGIVGRQLVRGATALGKVAEVLEERYLITPSHISKFGLSLDPDTGRVVIPVNSFLGEERGAALRSLHNEKPKTLTHTEQGAISWFVNPTHPGVIIVEDQFSAIRASDYLTSVALLGTHLNDDRIDEIRASGLRPVYLALDADAWGKAVKYVIAYRNRLPLQAVQLHKDIKDMNRKEAIDFFSSIMGGE